MNLTITAKHVELDDTDKQLAEALSNKLAEDFPKLTSATLVISQERGIFNVEARLNGKNVDFNASAKDDRVPAAITATFDKLNKQMRRLVDRFQDLAIKANPELKDKIWTSKEIE